VVTWIRVRRKITLKWHGPTEAGRGIALQVLPGQAAIFGLLPQLGDFMWPSSVACPGRIQTAKRFDSRSLRTRRQHPGLMCTDVALELPAVADEFGLRIPASRSSGR